MKDPPPLNPKNIFQKIHCLKRVQNYKNQKNFENFKNHRKKMDVCVNAHMSKIMSTPIKVLNKSILEP